MNENVRLKFWKKRRYILGALVFFGFFTSNILRVNLSIAIVVMTTPSNGQVSTLLSPEKKWKIKWKINKSEWKIKLRKISFFKLEGRIWLEPWTPGSNSQFILQGLHINAIFWWLAGFKNWWKKSSWCWNWWDGTFNNYYSTYCTNKCLFIYCRENSRGIIRGTIRKRINFFYDDN